MVARLVKLESGGKLYDYSKLERNRMINGATNATISNSSPVLKLTWIELEKYAREKVVDL